METLDSYEAPRVLIRLTCEGPDCHDNPPHTYRVRVNEFPSGKIDCKAWETVCETMDYGEARAQFLLEARRAYRDGEVDYDWLEEKEELGGGWDDFKDLEDWE